jgi:pimeloyl-ACP methyl ester carboxylesterase
MDGIARRSDQMRWFHSLLRSGYPFTARKGGLDHDLSVFDALGDPSVERIACPTLVVHGRNDASVPFEHSQLVARGVPGAEFHTVESCGHFVWLAPEFPALRRTVVAFAERHAHAASPLA